jgi:hypothetical protein
VFGLWEDLLNTPFGMCVIVSPNIFSIWRGRGGFSTSSPFSDVFGIFYSCVLVAISMLPFIMYTFMDGGLLEDGGGP